MQRIQKGFTLIELMIVVAIIGILAAVAIPAYQDYVVKAKMSKVSSTMASLKTALAMYSQEQGGFPDIALGDLGVTGGAGGTAGTPLPDLNPLNSVWAALGFATYPSLPNEVAALSYYAPPVVVGATTSSTFSLILTLANIRVGSIDNTWLAISPTTTGNNGITAHVIGSATATNAASTDLVQGTAMQWYYACNQGTAVNPVDVLIPKYFSNPTGAQNCLGQ